MIELVTSHLNKIKNITWFLSCKLCGTTPTLPAGSLSSSVYWVAAFSTTTCALHVVIIATVITLLLHECFCFFPNHRAKRGNQKDPPSVRARFEHETLKNKCGTDYHSGALLLLGVRKLWLCLTLVLDNFKKMQRDNFQLGLCKKK